MKTRINKQFIIGILVGILLSCTIITAVAVEQIISAKYNDVTITVNGEPMELAAPLISVVDSSSPNYFSNYMPVRTVLENIG